MSFGFTTYAQNGDVLASSDYFGYHILSTPEFISNSTSTQTGAYTTYRVNYTNTSAPLIFFALAVNDTAAFWALYKDGDYWYFNVSGNVRQTVSKIKCFGRVVNAPTSGHGVVVRGSDGGVNFSSSSGPLWITDYQDIPAIRLNTPNFSDFNFSLSYANVNPIAMCPLVGYFFNAAQQDLTLIGWKRYNETSYSTTAIASGSRAFVDVKFQSIIIGDLL